MGVVFGPILDIWNSFVCGYSNHRNARSKSGICCRVRPSFLRVGAVVLACTFPRPSSIADYNPRKSSTDPEKSRDFVRQEDSRLVTTTHFCDNFQCSRMLRTAEHLFLLASTFFFCMARGEFLDFCHLCTLSFV